MLAPDAIFERALLTDAGEAAEGTLITFGAIPPALLEGEGTRFYRRYKRIYGWSRSRMPPRPLTL
ncbi:MAG TPA: hypothetical protein VEQ37_03145 [Actinomycetota bacterium]|nr:hypothetical protein [Actinomycetota bacterium]